MTFQTPELTAAVRSELDDLAYRLDCLAHELPAMIDAPTLAELLEHDSTSTLDSWASSGHGPAYGERGRHRFYLMLDVVVWFVGQRRGGPIFDDGDVARAVVVELDALWSGTAEDDEDDVGAVRDVSEIDAGALRDVAEREAETAANAMLDAAARDADALLDAAARDADEADARVAA